jgi:hypothetical protein
MSRAYVTDRAPDLDAVVDVVKAEGAYLRGSEPDGAGLCAKCGDI